MSIEGLVGFTSALRHAGIPVTADRTQAFLQAASIIGAEQRAGVYWSGRSTLCSSPDDLELYDRVFQAWFGSEPPTNHRRTTESLRVQQAALIPSGDADQDQQDRDQQLATRASSDEVLRHRDIAELSEAERKQLAALFETIMVTPPRRRAVRTRPAHRGRFDYRRTLRDQLRRGGELGDLRWRRRKNRPRRLVFLIDISGSMSPYADSLLRLAHRVSTQLPGLVETFTIGTRLTRVTTALKSRHPQDALRLAGQVVPDWSGGTRLGEVLRAFLVRWGRRGMARGAVVVIASDGWERGDARLLGEQVRQLSLMAHRVIWSNPHRGKDGFQPIQAGMAASLPFCDHFVAGHSMAAFAELMEVVADA